MLPTVLQSDYFPVGVKGLVLAAMLAAAMSTFDSTLNAGASYVVRDLYQPRRPGASDRRLMRVSYLASALLVAVALVLAWWLGGSVLGVWIGIAMLLFPAFLVPFALRWYWARFNGEGFASGLAGGFGAALFFALVDPGGWNEATRFLGIALSSLACALAGTWLTPAVDGATLRRFYERVRPWGTWPRAWRAADVAEHRADGWRLVRALVWQICTFLLPMTLVLRLWGQAAVLAVIWLLLGVRLWRDHEKAAA